MPARHHPLQLGVLAFQLTQANGFGGVHASELGLPTVKRLLRAVMFATYIRYRGAGLGLVQDPDNLLFGKSLAFHWVLLILEIRTQKVDRIWEASQYSFCGKFRAIDQARSWRGQLSKHLLGREVYSPTESWIRLISTFLNRENRGHSDIGSLSISKAANNDSGIGSLRTA